MPMTASVTRIKEKYMTSTARKVSKMEALELVAWMICSACSWVAEEEEEEVPQARKI